MVVKLVKGGRTEREIALELGIGKSSIWRWKKLEQEQGDLKNRPLNRKYKKLDPLDVAQYIEEHKDAFAIEIARHFKVSLSSILYILKKKLKYVRKKTAGLSRTRRKSTHRNQKKVRETACICG